MKQRANNRGYRPAPRHDNYPRDGVKKVRPMTPDLPPPADSEATGPIPPVPPITSSLSASCDIAIGQSIKQNRPRESFDPESPRSIASTTPLTSSVHTTAFTRQPSELGQVGSPASKPVAHTD
jgi:hypothetical protein